jgi:hypothetical protein
VKLTYVATKVRQHNANKRKTREELEGQPSRFSIGDSSIEKKHNTVTQRILERIETKKISNYKDWYPIEKRLKMKLLLPSDIQYYDSSVTLMAFSFPVNGLITILYSTSRSCNPLNDREGLSAE